jgi:hypothetical protein
MASPAAVVVVEKASPAALCGEELVGGEEVIGEELEEELIREEVAVI